MNSDEARKHKYVPGMFVRLLTTRPFWSSLTQNDECFFIHRKELLFIVSIVQPSVLGIRQDSRRWFFVWSRSGHGWSVLTPADIEVVYDE